MNRTQLKAIKPGDRAAATVYDASGKVLVLKGAEFSGAGIEKLKFHEIPFVYTDGPGMIMCSVFETGLLPEMQRLVWNFSESGGKNSIVLKAYNLEEIKIFAAYNSEPAAKMVYGHVFKYFAGKMNKALKNAAAKYWDYMDYRTVKNYLCFHAVNAACISMIIGARMGLKEKELSDLCVGSLLSDLKMKTYGFTGEARALDSLEKEEVKQHVYLSSEDARATYGIPSAAAGVAGQHHERFNGSGYPKALKAGNIGALARIAAVADVYDALISGRPHRQAYFPGEAWDYIMTNSGVLFDRETASAFASSVPKYMPGDTVLLNDGREAIVAENNPAKMQEPVIKIIEKTGKSDIIPDAAIDLSGQKSTVIVRTVKSARREE